MSNLSSGSQSHHHKSKQNSHHPHSGSNLSNQGSHSKNSNHGPNNGGGQGPKKNVRAWGSINSNNSANNNNNNSNSSSNPSMSSAGGPAGAWRNGSPAGNQNNPPHFSNGIGQSSPGPGSHFSQQHSNHIHPSAASDDKLVMKAMHERMVWFIMTLVGVTVTATTKSGQRFQGLLSSAVTESELCITLKRAIELPVASTSNLSSPSTPTQSRGPPVVKSTLIILAKELVEVVASDIDLNQISSVATGATHPGSGFKTDAETLGYRLDSNGQPIIREKELKTWAPSATELPSGSGSGNATPGLSDQEVMNGLEDTLFPKASESDQGANRRTFDQPWDQFEANEKLFGTRTDFDEEMYTTKLDRTAKDFKERERKAEILAREIMAASSSNPHVQEERGLAVADDSGMNEEDKYGAVIRSEGAYVPPGARKAAAANRGSLQPPSSASANKSSASGLQQQGGTNSMARHLKNINEPETASAAAKNNSAAPGQGSRAQAKPMGSNVSSNPSGPAPANANLQKENPSSQASQAPHQKPSPAPAQSTSQVSATAVSSSPQPPTSTAAIPNPANPAIRKVVPQQQPKLSKPPDEVTPRFKAFVSDEKERLQQKKKDLLKKEKESRLADLRAFSLSFKLPMALPKDLEPIVKKPANPETSKTTDPAAGSSEKDPRKLQQIPEEAGRRASAAVTATADKNHARYLGKVYNPSNLQAVSTINPPSTRVAANLASKPSMNPSISIGLKKLGPLAVIPPYKPNNQKPAATPSTNSSNPSKPESLTPSQPKVSSRFANIPPIPPFKPKNNPPESGATTSMVAKDLKMNQKTAAFNPSAKTFSPLPGQKASTPSNRKSSQAQESSSTTPNPFFGTRNVKKGSSSMHVKEEFTPFKNPNVPEASSVGPAWNFTGKSYRQLFGASMPPHQHAPSHHPSHFMPHMMHHPVPHPQQHAHHHNHQHQQPHGGGAGHGHSQPHHPQNMMSNNMMTPPMHLQHSQQPHQPHHHHHHQPNVMPQMMSDEDGMSAGMSNNGSYMMGAGPGVIVNGPGMMVAGAGSGMPVPASHGYAPSNAPGMAQQQHPQQHQPHPHHLPPPVPPYMYQPQQQQPPPQPSSQSPYNGSYRHSHNGPAPNMGVGYGPPVPVGVNMGGPVPAGAYGGPPVGPGPGNPNGPYMGQMGGYGGSPMLGPSPVSSQNPGPGSSNGANSQAHVYSPQMGGMPGHGPPAMYPPPQIFHQQGGGAGGAGNGGPPITMGNLGTGTGHGPSSGPSPTSSGPPPNSMGGGSGGRGNGGGSNGPPGGQMYSYPVAT